MERSSIKLRRLSKLTVKKQAPQPREPKPDSLQFEKNSEEYLQHLIKKIFYPSSKHTNFSEVLPSLVSSQVDIQLYSLLALFYKNFIFSWFNSISKNEDFLHELINLVSVIAKRVEERLRSVSLQLLLLDKVPIVLDNHLNNVKTVIKNKNSKFETDLDCLDKHIAVTGDLNDLLNYLKVQTSLMLNVLLPTNEINSNLTNSFLDSLISKQVYNLLLKLSSKSYFLEIVNLICDKILAPSAQIHKEGAEEETFSTKINKISNCISKLSINSGQIYSFNLSIFPLINDLVQLQDNSPILYTIFKLLPNIPKSNVLFSNFINSFSINETQIVELIQTIRTVLFPDDDKMGPPRVEPTEEQFRSLQSQVNSKILAILGKFKISWFDQSDIAVFLNCIENENWNLHLFVNLWDLIITELFPELCK